RRGCRVHKAAKLQKPGGALIRSRGLPAAVAILDPAAILLDFLRRPGYAVAGRPGGCCMPVDVERRRVLMAARQSEAAELHDLFAQTALKTWDVLEADSFERARFLLQYNPCDVLLVDESLY